MKNKKIVVSITLIFVVIIGYAVYLKTKTTSKEAKLREKEISALSPEIGQKKSFYTDVFMVKNVNLIPHIILTVSDEKNLIVDSNHINEIITPYGFNKPITDAFKKITVDYVPDASEFKLVGVKANKIYTEDSLSSTLLKLNTTYVDVTLEDQNGEKSKMPASAWSLDTNSAFPSFEASMMKDDNTRIFKDRAKMYKTNPKATLLVRYCGASLMAVSQNDVRQFNVQERMDQALQNIFNPGEIDFQKLPETVMGGSKITCYNLKISSASTFLKANYLLPRVVYGFWSK